MFSDRSVVVDTLHFAIHLASLRSRAHNQLQQSNIITVLRSHRVIVNVHYILNQTRNQLLSHFMLLHFRTTQTRNVSIVINFISTVIQHNFQFERTQNFQ